MRRIAITVLSLLLAATSTRALCPSDPPTGDAPQPVVTVAPTSNAFGLAVTVTLAAPTCLAVVMVETQGPRVLHAALLGPTEMPVSSAFRYRQTERMRFTFLVSAWLPKGETRYVLWFPHPQRYAAVELAFMHQGSDVAASATWGTQTIPPRQSAAKPKPAPSRKSLRRKLPTRKAIKKRR